MNKVVIADIKAVKALEKRVISPGLGYSVITVGGFEDNNTATWSDDKMWVNSSYVDPRSLNGDREKPEVVAVATHNSTRRVFITTTSVRSGGIIEPVIGSGTSYAAPAVAAEAALLMQAYNNFKNWPEMVRAVIMASADHNIEGASKLSEKDGAGGIDISKANQTGAGALAMLAYASDFPKHFTFYATQGQKVRVVINGIPIRIVIILLPVITCNQT